MIKVFLVFLTANLFFNTLSYSQTLQIDEMAPLPFKISNNAVCKGKVSGEDYVYSFAGIDSTKIWSGITNRSFRYRISTNLWDTIAPLPDSLTKIAAAASYIDGKIYIIGGYHVYSNGNEVSSNKVHVYDCETNTYLPNASPIPLPIDDHVQAVWNDSLIYVVTGWSNSGNVPNVQIFNPSTNSWSVGTSTPNTSFYKAFGASGTIIDDTIYYFGGASTGVNFPAQKQLRKGIIDANNPTQIVWTNPSQLDFCYRGVTFSDQAKQLYFCGGSKVSYNYDGIAYNGSGGVSPANKLYFVPTANTNTWLSYDYNLPMDLRGVAEIDDSLKFIAGGMLNGQQVSNKTFRIKTTSSLNINEIKKATSIYPNPIINVLNVSVEKGNTSIFDLRGVKIKELEITNFQLDFSEIENGIYFLKFDSEYKMIQVSH